ncbi:MAG: serine/threonine-protein kinase [Myxococcota bacterium]
MPASRPSPSDHSGLRHVCDIARGGMGRVELVVRQDGDFVRLFARKRLLRDLVDDEESRAMFLDEARIAGMLRHPNVVSVHDIGEDEAGLFLLMDYIEGVPLHRVVRSARDEGVTLPIQLCVEVLRQVAEGLHAAHELRGLDGTSLGLVHRDVSPSNILIELSGGVRVADFGIARAAGRRTRTSTGMLKGKMGYLAPEVLRFQKPDRRSDLYSLGVVLYEMLHCRRLYSGEMTEVAQSILNDPAPDFGGERNDIPEALVELGFELLAKDPEHRPVSAKEVGRRLQAILVELQQYEPPITIEEYVAEHIDTSPIVARRTQAEEVSRRVRLGIDDSSLAEPTPTERDSPRRRSSIYIAIAGVALMGAGTLFGFWVSQNSNDPSPPPAESNPVEPATTPEAEPEIEGVIDPPEAELEALEPDTVSRTRPVRPVRMRPEPRPTMMDRRMTLEPWEW